MISHILSIVLPVFIVIWFGTILRMIGLVPPELIKDANRLIYYASLPALLFYKIAIADFSKSFNSATLFGLAISIALCFCLSYWWGSFKKYPPAVQGAFTQAATRGNLAYVALAVISSAYGESGVARAGILLGFIVPAMSVVSIVALILPYKNQGAGISFFSFFKEIVYNPMFIGPALGIIWSYFKLPLPQIIANGLHIFSAMSLPLALICIGATFSFNKFRGEFGTALFATFFKIVLLPIFAAIMVYIMGVRGEDLGVAILLAGAPTATVAYILAHQLRGDTELSSSVIMISTLLTIATYTVALYCLRLMGN